MFDDTTKIILFAMALAGWVFELVGQVAVPVNVVTAVDVRRLPEIPERAMMDGSPSQTKVPEIRVELSDDFDAELLFGYVLEGRIVTRQEYRQGLISMVSPLDLGIVWGELAEPGATDRLTFSTGHRRLRYRVVENAGVPLIEDWEQRLTNNHLIPANQQVFTELMGLEVGAEVRLRGYLVEVTGETIRPWRSSTRRDDGSAVGGCEIMLVTGVEVLSEEKVAAVERTVEHQYHRSFPTRETVWPASFPGRSPF